MKEKIKKNIAKTFLLMGIFLPIFSFLFASDYRRNAGLKYNLDKMTIIIYKGKPIDTESCLTVYRQGKPERACDNITTYKGRIEIPFKAITIVSLVLVIIGIILLMF